MKMWKIRIESSKIVGDRGKDGYEKVPLSPPIGENK